MTAVAPETDAESDPAAAAEGDPEVAEGLEAVPLPSGAPVGRTNVQASGNRYLPGTLDLSAEPTTLELPFATTWVLPLSDGSLIAVGEDGTSLAVTLDGTTTTLASVDPTVAPLAYERDGEIVLAPATVGVDSDLPDASVVSGDGVTAWYDGATERVPHGALGDTIESTRLVIVRAVINPKNAASGSLADEDLIVVDLEDDPTQPVFEGLTPLLADVDGDGEVDVLTTISDGESGARLAVFGINGELIAESEPIGRGNRWRHQIAVAPTGPNGEVEVIEVQTPHIGGLLQFQRFDGEALALQHQIGEFRSHVLSSRNLDGAVVFDGDGDGQPEAIVPTQGMDAIAVVEPVPTDDGPVLIELGGATVSSNLALGEIETGLRFAVALSDGRLLVW